MRTLILALMALNLMACAHEQIQIDRELALKLADRKDTVVVQSAPPTINVYANGGSNSASAPYNGPTLDDGSPDNRRNCTDSPVYNIQGQFDHYTKRCFGSN